MDRPHATPDSLPDNVPPARVVTFDMFNPFSEDEDFHRAWIRLREQCPYQLVWTPHHEGHWIALAPDLVAAVYADSSRFSSRIVLVPKSTAGIAYSDFLPLSLDPPNHAPYRRILNEKLYGAAINPLRDGIRALTVALIESFRGAGHCDFVRDFAEKLPLQVFMTMVDLPIEDLPKLKHLAEQFTRPDGSISPAEANQAFRDYLVPIMTARKGTGRTDLLTHIAESRVNDRPLTDDEATNMASQALVGGLDTVVNFLSFAMLTLARLPDLQARIAKDLSLVPELTHELLRRLPIVSSAREVVADILVDGVTLRAGDMVVSPTALYALNPKMHRDPLDIDIDRPDKQHATFGSGPHTCPGQFLARMEIRIFLEEWFSRIPSFRLAPGQTVRHRGGNPGGTDPYRLEWG